MRISKLSACFGLSVLLATSCLFAGQAAKPTNTEASAKAFVQSFYTWYLSKGPRGKEKSSDDALKLKRSAFDTELYRELKEDSDVSAKNKDEIVGLDFDPFEDSQDPCSRYVAGKVTAKGDGYLVEVFGICEGKKNKTPDVTPEVSFKDGKWVFVNFHYGNAGKEDNLLSILKQLREERTKKPTQK